MKRRGRGGGRGGVLKKKGGKGWWEKRVERGLTGKDGGGATAAMAMVWREGARKRRGSKY